MEIRRTTQDRLALAAAVVTAPAWVPCVAAIMVAVCICAVCERLARIIDPPGWRKVFALWPVECDPWPEDGFKGWVWLEPVWRNPNSPGWTKYRRDHSPTAE